MGYFDPKTVQKRVRERYRNRFLYLASMLIFLVFLALAISDPNLHVWSLIMLVWPIAHTAYLLYLEFSERAIERELKKHQTDTRIVEGDGYWRLADEEESAGYDHDENPKRKRSRQDIR